MNSPVNPPSRPSIHAVAAAAGCSIATVSNALNYSGRISEKTRKKILRVCAELNYVPQSIGRSLRLQRSETVGLLFYPSCAYLFQNVFYGEIMQGLEEALEQRGYDVLLAGWESSTRPNLPPRIVERRKTDGLVLLGGFPRKAIEHLYATRIPLLLLDTRAPDLPIDSVTTDGFGASVEIVRHLHSLGHRRMIFAGYPIEDFNTDERIRGYLDAAGKLGTPASSMPVLRTMRENDEIGPELVRRLRRPRGPTAVIAVNDTMAAALVKHFQAAGLKVPGDVSVFGFDDDAFSRDCTPPVSTVRMDKKAIGRHGAETILARIEQKDIPVRSLTLPTALIHRASVSAPPQGRSQGR